MYRAMKVLSQTLAIAALATAGLAQAPATTNRAAAEKQVLAAERAVNEAVAKGDMKTFHAIIAPDAVGVDMGGINKVNVPDFDKMMLQTKLTSWNIDGSQFLWINDAAVVHMYRWTGKGTFQGQPIPSPVWTSTLWTNKGGKWIGVFHQETAAMMPSAPPPAATPSKK
jgi:hypothetical protein